MLACRCLECDGYWPAGWCNRCDGLTGDPQEPHKALGVPEGEVPSLTERESAIVALYSSAPSGPMGGKDFAAIEQRLLDELDECDAEHVSSCLYAIASAEQAGTEAGRPKKAQR